MSARFRLGFIAIAFAGVGVAACGWSPTRPFEREAPQVKEAIAEYDAGEAGAAAALLQDYLQTGACEEGSIGTPPRIRERANGSFDLGLAIFKIAEQYGSRFGEEDRPGHEAPAQMDPNLKGQRGGQVECALRVVRAVADDTNQPPTLRARARYLEGNLLFLNVNYKEAVTAYDAALELAPAMGDAGPIGTSDAAKPTYQVDPIGADAAWNRAIALRRIEDQKDAGNDASPNNDGGGDSGNEGDSGQNDPNKDGGQNESNDAGKDSGSNGDKDAGNDSGSDQNNPPPKQDPPNQGPDAGAPPPPSRQSQDDRILDQLENAPTVQQEAAKKHSKTRKVRGMSDK